MSGYLYFPKNLKDKKDHICNYKTGQQEVILWWGNWIKMSATMVDRRRKILK